MVGCYGPEGSALLRRTDEGSIVAAYPASEGEQSSSSGSVQFSVKAGGALAPRQPQLLPAADVCAPGGVLRRLVDGYTPVRCTAELVLSAAGAAGSPGLAAAFDELEEQLCGAASFYIVESLGGAAADSSGSGGGGAALAAGQHALPGMGPFSVLGASWERVPVLRPYERTAPANGGGSNGGVACSAPRLGWQPGAATLRHASLCLDVLVYVPRDMPAAEAVGAIVRPAVRCQLRAMRTDAEEAAAAGAALMIENQPPLRALHFMPPGWPHHVTQVRAAAGMQLGGREGGPGATAKVLAQQWLRALFFLRAVVRACPGCISMLPSRRSTTCHPLFPIETGLSAAAAVNRGGRRGAAAAAQGPAPPAGLAAEPPPAARGQRLRL